MTNTDDHSDHDIDKGLTLIDLIVAVVVVGSLMGVALFAFSGIRAEAAATRCQTDRRQLSVSAERYLAQRPTDVIPATGIDHDRFEQTLVDGGFMRAPSRFHDLDATGAVTPEENISC